MILKPKSCSFPLQRYGCCKNHFCIHVNGDVNFDKLVHENMFYSVIVGFPKSGHIFEMLPVLSFRQGGIINNFRTNLSLASAVAPYWIKGR